MSFKVLYVTATAAEAIALSSIGQNKKSGTCYRYGNSEIFLLIGGIGAVPTAWNICNWIAENGKPDLAVNAGIAGSFMTELAIGDVVMPVSDCFADYGIEDGNNFQTLFETGLSNGNEFPFRNGMIDADLSYTGKLTHLMKPVRALTVNTSTGSETTRKRLVEKFNPGIETMEGASFFYICAMQNIPFFAVRAISNMIGIRDRDSWNIPLALDRLSEKLAGILKILD